MSAGLGLINLVGLLPLGVAWLVTVRLVFARRSSQGDDLMQRGMTIAGWLLVLVGMAGFLAALMGPLAYFVWPVLLIIVSVAVGRFRHNERRSLLWSLALAAERGIPLEQAAAAFADERYDETGLRAARLARELERGVPLPQALQQSGNFLPFDGKLACGVGWQAGCLGPSLRRVVEFQEELDHYLRGAIEKLLYCSILLAAFSAMATFLMIRVVPALEVVYAEFSTDLPRPTEWVLGLSDAFSFGRAWLWFVPLYFAAFTLTCVSLLYYLGWITWEPWLLRRIWRRLHTAWILRYLSFLVGQDRPLDNAVRLLSANYPSTYIAQRLYRATGLVAEGRHWCDALLIYRLIRPNDAAVLRAAERAGNLPWAMEEMAESNLRRLSWRLQSFLSIGVPAVIAVFGVMIFGIVVTLFLPFPELVRNLVDAV